MKFVRTSKIRGPGYLGVWAGAGVAVAVAAEVARVRQHLRPHDLLEGRLTVKHRDKKTTTQISTD
jgi:hypothetical protein